jgi:hypothetical protein
MRSCFVQHLSAVYQGNIFECHPRDSGSRINGLFGQTALLASRFRGNDKLFDQNAAAIIGMSCLAP